MTFVPTGSLEGCCQPCSTPALFCIFLARKALLNLILMVGVGLCKEIREDPGGNMSFADYGSPLLTMGINTRPFRHLLEWMARAGFPKSSSIAEQEQSLSLQRRQPKRCLHNREDPHHLFHAERREEMQPCDSKQDTEQVCSPPAAPDAPLEAPSRQNCIFT